MKNQKLLVALTLVNAALLIYSIARPRQAGAQGAAPILHGRGLEIVDDRGKVRASISILPADPNVKMPDGTRGTTETVLLRLINSKGGPNVKIAATEAGSGASFTSEREPAYVQILAEDGDTSLKLLSTNGRKRLLKP